MPELQLSEQAIKTRALNVFPSPHNKASVVKFRCKLFPTASTRWNFGTAHILSKLFWFSYFYLSLYVLKWALQHCGNQPYFQSSERRLVQPGTSSSSAQDRGPRCSLHCCTGLLTGHADKPHSIAARRASSSTFCSEGRAVPCHASWQPPLPLNRHATAASRNLLCFVRAAGDWPSLKLYPSSTSG